MVSGDALISVEGAASPVPEPASWLFMVAGFGMVGYAMRRRSILFAPSIA
ncbi:Loki-CTERM sorting domain-containing protein [Sphingomonas aerolata]